MTLPSIISLCKLSQNQFSLPKFVSYRVRVDSARAACLEAVPGFQAGLYRLGRIAIFVAAHMIACLASLLEAECSDQRQTRTSNIDDTLVHSNLSQFAGPDSGASGQNMCIAPVLDDVLQLQQGLAV